MVNASGAFRQHFYENIFTSERLEREQIVLRQAVRLRQNRVEALLNKEREKIRKGTADLRFA